MTLKRVFSMFWNPPKLHTHIRLFGSSFPSFLNRTGSFGRLNYARKDAINSATHAQVDVHSRVNYRRKIGAETRAKDDRDQGKAVISCISYLIVKARQDRRLCVRRHDS
jgi:hypothetical protein